MYLNGQVPACGLTVPNPPPLPVAPPRKPGFDLSQSWERVHLATASREAMPMKTALGWSAKLTRTIVLNDGTRLVTLGEVRAFILKEPKHIQERGSWQHAAELMILAAERGGSIEAATAQIEDALFLEARYVRP